jgi:ATP-dependent Clp protease ATP-binding subunit ClpA
MATTVTFPVKLTPRAEKVLLRASHEAQSVGAKNFIGVEHIFLAMLADEHAIPTQVLTKVGVVEDARRELETILRSEGYKTPSTEVWRPPPS